MPSRDEYFIDLQLILEGNVIDVMAGIDEQTSLFPSTQSREEALELVNEFGFVNVDEIIGKTERLSVVDEVAERYRFLHWELQFADLFKERGGFDLIVGNPPWIKLDWEEGISLGEKDPIAVLRKLTAEDISLKRESILINADHKQSYINDYIGIAATQSILRSQQYYPILQGVRTNLYKNFISQAFMLNSNRGMVGFVHPSDAFNESNAQKFRECVYQRIHACFVFINEKKWFPIGNQARYSICLYRKPDEVSFIYIANLFNTNTIDQCMERQHGVTKKLQGIKDEFGNWNVLGHPDRVIQINSQKIEKISEIYGEKGENIFHTILPELHSKNDLSILNAFSKCKYRMRDLKSEFEYTDMYNETNAKRDKAIKFNTQFPRNSEDLILSGPHIGMANPFAQTPRRKRESKFSFDTLDLCNIPANYIPRTNFIPGESNNERRYIRKLSWDNTATTASGYRLALKRDRSPSHERTLIPSIIHRGVKHIYTVASLSFRSNHEMIRTGAYWTSLPFDYLLRTVGKGHMLHFVPDVIDKIPIVEHKKYDSYLMLRFLCLNCLTNNYSELWSSIFDESFCNDAWTRTDIECLDKNYYSNLSPQWIPSHALRMEYTRRQALVEIDVLAAMALELKLSELNMAYRLQFPVLKQYEDETFYDQAGRMIFTVNKSYSGVGLSRADWNKVASKKSGIIEQEIEDDTLPGGPVRRTILYEAPFHKCKREQDYETAWREFERRGIGRSSDDNTFIDNS